MNAFVADPAFVAKHPAPLPFAFEPENGKAVTFPAKDGTSAKGYYVPGKKAGIIMVHEWWGLNDYIKREAERLHDATGYGVLAVDLYDGKVATDAKEAGEYMQNADPKRDTAIVSGAIAALKTGALGNKFTKLGTIGWCFGGGWSLNAAMVGGSSVKAAVAFYGMPPADVSALKAPVLFVWAKQDNWINAKVVSDFQSRMKASNKPLTVLSYDADHAFANPSNPKYKKADAEDAMAKTLAFYKKHLG